MTLNATVWIYIYIYIYMYMYVCMCIHIWGGPSSAIRACHLRGVRAAYFWRVYAYIYANILCVPTTHMNTQTYTSLAHTTIQGVYAYILCVPTSWNVARDVAFFF